MDGCPAGGKLPRHTEVLVGGLRFPESPRWHKGRLWYLDLPSHSLRATDLQGNDELIEKFERRPAALDFLRDGTPLVALQESLQIVRVDDGSVYADLSQLEHEGERFWKFGDMVVDGEDRLYVGCIAPRVTDAQPWEEFSDAVALVLPDGSSRVAVGDVKTPNGMAITPDGENLVVAESLPARLVRFAIGEAGLLGSGDVYAEVPGHIPDGICVDAEGSVWIAGLYSKETIRVTADGAVAESVAAADGHLTIATMLGGPEGRHLFVVSCQTPNGKLASWDDCLVAEGFIEMVEVEVCTGGWPSN